MWMNCIIAPSKPTIPKSSISIIRNALELFLRANTVNHVSVTFVTQRGGVGEGILTEHTEAIPSSHRGHETASGSFGCLSIWTELNKVSFEPFTLP